MAQVPEEEVRALSIECVREYRHLFLEKRRGAIPLTKNGVYIFNVANYAKDDIVWVDSMPVRMRLKFVSDFRDYLVVRDSLGYFYKMRFRDFIRFTQVGGVVEHGIMEGVFSPQKDRRHYFTINWMGFAPDYMPYITLSGIEHDGIFRQEDEVLAYLEDVNERHKAIRRIKTDKRKEKVRMRWQSREKYEQVWGGPKRQVWVEG